MSWTTDGRPYESDSDLSNGIYTQKVVINKNVLLKYVRTWIIFMDNPGLTNITMKIYLDNEGDKGNLLYSSLTTHTKAEIITLENGVKEVYFEFDDKPLDDGNTYHFCLEGTSSGLSTSSKIAWKTTWPDPVYGGFSESFANRAQYPFTIVLIGAEF